MSTPTQPRRLASPEPRLYVLPFYAKSVESVGRCPSRFYGRWSFHWYWHAVTTAMRHWLDHLALSSTGYRLLQSLINTDARPVCLARKFEQITPRLHDLHWLRLPQRIEFKLATLVSHCLHDTVPQYLACEACELRSVTNINYAADYALHPRHRSTFHWLAASPSQTVPSLLLVLVCGTACHLTSLIRRHHRLMFQHTFYCNVWLRDTDVFCHC